ncbi:MAG: glycine--tRNA ligase subunit beta [Candidatus Cloacimonadota bacterium]|nr:glycine--tRNA ligase subunit beta [Candidatus Cloacimonadota bacterium]
MQNKDFLFELGVEELPAGYIKPALDKLVNSFQDHLNQYNLAYKKIIPFSTPRRLTIIIEQLQTQQKDQTIERVGPTTKIAYNEDGSLSKAAEGFLRGAGAGPGDLYEVDSNKGKKIAVKINKKGENTNDILPKICPEAIATINFPKIMRWGNCKKTFARPIRWIVAILGKEIIKFSYANIESGNTSYGNRYIKLNNPVEVNFPAEYEKKLKSMSVIADFTKRKDEIEVQLDKMFENRSENIVEDTKLLNIVNNLVEFPYAVLAQFEKKYLNLPEKIITSTLSQHQKYFAVKDADGRLTNNFVFISNGDPKYSELIKLGNEKVIKARLEDAQFYFKEDTKKPLESYLPKLKDVTFQAELGTLWEKTNRIKNIVEFVANKLKVDNKTKKNALRAALLCKADLVTNMLGEKEFTKLEGYVGSKYALISNEDPEVASAIYEHYQPKGQNDALPQSLVGAIVAIADKIDTVAGIIAIDMIPTGSNDPFALRRAANGIVQIIGDKKLDLDLHQLIETAYENLNSKLENENNNKQEVYNYFKQRVKWYLLQNNLDYDVIDSVMHIDYADIPDLKQRALDMQKFKEKPEFNKLVIGFKRVSNILSDQKEFLPFQPELLQETAEKMLYEKYLILKQNIEELLPHKDYEKIMFKLVEFGKYIDIFFDEVLVNTENEKLRKNRYSLLLLLRKLFLKVADIALIVVNN